MKARSSRVHARDASRTAHDRRRSSAATTRCWPRAVARRSRTAPPAWIGRWRATHRPTDPGRSPADQAGHGRGSTDTARCRRSRRQRCAPRTRTLTTPTLLAGSEGAARRRRTTHGASMGSRPALAQGRPAREARAAAPGTHWPARPGRYRASWSSAKDKPATQLEDGQPVVLDARHGPPEALGALERSLGPARVIELT